MQRGVDVGAMDAPPAEEIAGKPAFKGIDAPRGEPDDLKRLPNVNPKLEQRLNDTGVFHFWQIADLDAEMAESLDRALNLRGRLMRDNWVVAAKKLTEESASA